MDNQVVFLTGLSGSGKTTLGKSISSKIRSMGDQVVYIDGDEFRKGLSSDLGFTLEDRFENIRRMMEVCRLLLNSGTNVVVSFIAPTESIRNIMRNNINNLIEVQVNCPLIVCMDRNPKKLYSKDIPNFTGIGQPFEIPLEHSIEVKTDAMSVDECVDKVMLYINSYSDSFDYNDYEINY